MDRNERLVLLDKHIKALTEDVSDIPYNENRFAITATPDERGYGVTFMFIDAMSKDAETFYTKWLPLKNKNGIYIYPMDVIYAFNTFVIERRVY